MENQTYERRRKWLSGISLAVVAVIAILATVFIGRWLGSFSDDSFRDYIRSFGPAGWLVLLGLQFLQVFIALIPGELLETGAGYAFGPVWGTLICYAGVAMASALVFLLTRRFGVKLVEVFISREKINQLSFLRTERKRNTLVFLLFLIPGTPKDLLTYFVGLTDMKLGSFLLISLIARLPSVLSSTAGGHLLGEGNYVGALWLYGITGAVSIVGLLIYNAIMRKKQK
jgi:uncharacterized membrane protein YdjX (TVP38/TMEM64 family)